MKIVATQITGNSVVIWTTIKIPKLGITDHLWGESTVPLTKGKQLLCFISSQAMQSQNENKWDLLKSLVVREILK